ncbi:hypothetical protein [Micromonospora sp. NBC_01813]|uniref:hypothetical protein n=1 Tax=Micromonospora sp. NBC_01813 TaxID=2975988 RepID=UPI002DDC8969|nr:hypothetical protein [Micromonospora sp. NBC_01813]WSA10936.1 hypothetical protein OG958_09240 [Micromonospora sp. NBC_01813]
MIRLLVAAVALTGALAAALILTLIWLDASHHTGYRPERSELVAAARVVAVVAGLVIGFTAAVRTAELVRPPALALRALPVMATAGAVALWCLVLDEILYRQVIPLEPAAVDAASAVVPALLTAGSAAAAATVGFGIGLPFRWSPTRSTRSPAWYLLAVALAYAGLLVVPEFVRVGTEFATVRFLPAAAVDLPVGQPVPVDLPAGRSAIFRLWGRQLSTDECRVTGAVGDELPVTAPSVFFTDNGDGIVTVLLGTVEAPSSMSVVVVCQGPPGHSYQIGAAPTVDGLLGPLLHVPTWVLWVLGALPGLVLAGATAMARRRDRTAGQSSARQR